MYFSMFKKTNKQYAKELQDECDKLRETIQKGNQEIEHIGTKLDKLYKQKDEPEQQQITAIQEYGKLKNYEKIFTSLLSESLTLLSKYDFIQDKYNISPTNSSASLLAHSNFFNESKADYSNVQPMISASLGDELRLIPMDLTVALRLLRIDQEAEGSATLGQAGAPSVEQRRTPLTRLP